MCAWARVLFNDVSLFATAVKMSARSERMPEHGWGHGVHTISTSSGSDSTTSYGAAAAGESA